MEEVLLSSEQAELNLFEGMDGFEKFNPLDDSSLLAILDDLEEGTLLSLLGDESLVSDVTGEISNSFPLMESVNQERDTEELCPALLNQLPPVEHNGEDEPANFLATVETDTLNTPSSNTMKRPLPDSPSLKSPLKRARLDTSEELLSSVRHDHSYAAPPSAACHVTNEGVAGKTASTPVGSSSDEEGSLSDAGVW